jgi:hypothetical protein
MAADYPPNRSGAKQFAAAFCPNNSIGMADYVWLSAPGSEDVTTITVTYPDTVVDVRVNAYVQYCSGYPWGAAAGSSYWSDQGGPSGNFGYGNTYPGSTWYDYQVKPLNVAGWREGNHTICMTLASWSVGLFPQPSPSACSVLNLKIVYPWTTSGWSRVGVANDPNVQNWPADPPGNGRPAEPGDRLYWRHGVHNDGPAATSSIDFWIGKSGFSNGWDGTRSPEGSFSLANDATREIGYARSWSQNSTHDITQADVGKTLCQGINWSPVSNSGGSDSSTPACVTVPYQFNLTPTVSLNSTQAVEPGASIQPIRPIVNNSGPTKSYDNTKWEVTRFIVPKGAAEPNGAPVKQGACNYYRTGGKPCQKIGEGTRTFGVGPTNLSAIAVGAVEDEGLGSKVCFALSVTGFNKDHSNQNDGWWLHGKPACLKIGKKPKVQIWGSDAAVRGTINTSTTMKGGDIFGSWVEYGALSSGVNSNFASGAGFVSQTNSAQLAWSQLTFANVDDAGTPRFGQYALKPSFRPLPGIAAYFNGLQNKQPFNGGSLDANSFATGDSVVIREKVGDLTLDAQTLSKGRSVVVVASGTVTIKGNIDYAGTGLASLRDIPQLVIVASNVNIQQSVTNVDAWLIASGTVNTCSDSGAKLSGDICKDLLTIHGPVVANKLVLNRTAGSGTGPASGDPAEIINLRPDAYLWAQLVASGSGKAETVYTVELPPRF